jgi:hypothetical protein
MDFIIVLIILNDGTATTSLEEIGISKTCSRTGDCRPCDMRKSTGTFSLPHLDLNEAAPSLAGLSSVYIYWKAFTLYCVDAHSALFSGWVLVL